MLEPGLTYKKLNRLEEALDCFLKHHAILRNSTEVMYQLASLYPSDKPPVRTRFRLWGSAYSP